MNAPRTLRFVIEVETWWEGQLSGDPDIALGEMVKRWAITQDMFFRVIGFTTTKSPVTIG